MLRKKWLALLVAISMVAAMFPSTVFATSEPAESAGPAEPASQTSTEVPEDDTLVTEGNETPDVVTDEDTDTDETDQDTDETKKDEAVTPAEGTQPEETTEENKVEETQPEQPTVPETTPTETPNTSDVPTNEALGIATTSLDPQEDDSSDGPTPVSNADELRNAINNAKDGDTIKLLKGTYNVGTLNVDKAINFQGTGAEAVTIEGSIYYSFTGNNNVRIQGITLKAPEDNVTADQAINMNKAEGATLTIESCTIEDFLFGIGVNSGAKNCKVNVNNVTLNNVWCGVSVKEGEANNSIGSFSSVNGNVVYAVQKFGSETNKNNYYSTYEDSTTNTHPVTETESPKPNVGEGNWPAEAKIGNVYYGTLEDAVDAATNGTDETLVTITLTDDVELDKMLTISASDVVLDLNQKTITAADGFTGSADYEKHLIQVEGDNVTITNGNLTATNANRHVVNVWGGSVTLSGVTLDHSKAYAGAPLVINGGDAEGESGSATLEGNVTFVTGEKSWYNVNVDAKTGDSATLTVAAGANVVLDNNRPGIAVDSDDVTLNINGDIIYSGEIAAYMDTSKVSSVEVTGNSGLFVTGTVAKFGDTSYTDLQEAVTAAANASLSDDQAQKEVTLHADITVEHDIQVPAGANIRFYGNGYGNGHTITLDTKKDQGLALFSNDDTTTSTEGLKAGTTLELWNVNIEGNADSPAGYGVLVGGEGGVDVTMHMCNLKNLYTSVYCNNVMDSSAGESNITIEHSNLENVTHYYAVDNGYTPGAYADKHIIHLESNTLTGVGDAETWAVATVNGVGYKTLPEAVAAAKDNEIVQLQKNAELDTKLVIGTKGLQLDLNGYTISASDNFKAKNHLVEVTADGVTVANGTIKGNANVDHALHVWNADNVKLGNGLTLDNSATTVGGAPLVIGGSNVTLVGDVTFVTGENSWYGANVDSTVINQGTGEKKGSSLTVEGNITFQGPNENNAGIWVEDSKDGNSVSVSVAFNEGSSAQGNGVNGFEIVHVVKTDDKPQGTVTGAENAGLTTDGNGNYIVKPAPAPSEPSTGSTGSSHEHSYVWQGSPDEHWQYCTECGQVVSNGAHTFQWKDGVQVCSVCGYKVTQTSSTSTAPAGSTAAAAAAPAAGTTATAATGIPQTSDNSNPMLWVMLLALSGSALGGMTIYKKKKEN